MNEADAYRASQVEAARLYRANEAEAARIYRANQAEAARIYRVNQAEAARVYRQYQAATEQWYAEQRRTAAETAAREERARPVPVGTWAERLILQVGYRAAAMANHPDRGGSHERMIAINVANTALKAQGRI